MARNWTSYIGVFLLLIVIGIPIALRPQADQPTQQVDERYKLVIVTPHNEQIRHELAQAYNQYRAEQGLPEVIFDWRVSGGASDLRRSVLAQFATLSDPDNGIGVDLFFGGGAYTHDQLAGAGVSVSAGLSDEQIQAIFPQSHIGGEPLYHPQQLWLGTALSSFGIIYNRDILQRRNWPEPTTWSDFTRPDLQGEIALADPTHSSSIAVVYSTIIQRLGWQEGWAVLRRCFANARYFSASASRVPGDVAAGQATMGMCIDFYGRYVQGAMPNDAPDGGPRVRYVDPTRPLPDGSLQTMTLTTADPITLLHGAPHQSLAEDFIAWVLSEDAQHLWQAMPNTTPGPEKYALRRLPIRESLYQQPQPNWADPEVNPFAVAAELEPDAPNAFPWIGILTRSMAIHVHADLQAAWRAIHQTPTDHPHYDQMLTLFDAMPEELAQPDMQLLEDRDANELEWTLFFKANYQEIVRLSEEASVSD